MSLLRAENLVCRFGLVTALDGVSLTIGDGEVVSIVGANGAGKTSFVNAVTGYARISSGDVFFQNENITNRDVRGIFECGISRSFQVSQLFNSMSVWENLLVAGGVQRRGPRGLLKPLMRDDIENIALELMKEFELVRFAQYAVSMLPQGIRKVVDVAMALASRPKLIFLDEPTSGVSRRDKFALMDSVTGSLRRMGVATLFIEHDTEVVEKYSDRLIAFFEGRILFDGDVGEAMADRDVIEKVIGQRKSGDGHKYALGE